MKTFNDKNRGFTMIETLIAVAILMIAIAGPLTIAQKGLMSAIYAHDQITASYLTQDAMEFIKNIRDNNLTANPNRHWLNKLSTCSESTKCKIDTTTGDPNAGTAGISSCNPSSILYIGSLGYSHDSSGGTETKFSRCFYLVPSQDNVNSADMTPDEVKIVVEVSWDRGSQKNVITKNAVIYENEIFNIVK